MICTNIEQSKELVRLGLDPKTADVVWMCNKWLYSIKDNILHREQFSEQDTLAWSLPALLKVIKKFNPEVALASDNTWYCRCDKVESEYCDNPFTAAYDILCWLLEQGLIKKGDNDE